MEGEGGGKTYLGNATVSADGSFDDLRERMERWLDAGRELGLTINGAHLGLGHERQPVETFEWGSDAPFRNNTAQGRAVGTTTPAASY
jgi:hypothetical protein